MTLAVGTVVRYRANCRLGGYKKGVVGVVRSVPDKSKKHFYRIQNYVSVFGVDLLGRTYPSEWMISDISDLEVLHSSKALEDLL